MRPLSSLVLILVAASFGSADTKPLTPKQIRDGWLLLFDGESTFGWTIDGEAKVEKGRLILGGRKRTRAAVAAKFPQTKVVVQFDVQGEGAVAPRIAGTGGSISLQKSTGVRVEQSSPEGSGPHSPIEFDIPAHTQVVVHFARVQPLGLTSLFNGKDLAGWKAFKGDGKREKSKFSVTPEGWLNVKDGPGDLQTTKAYADFVLQLECISNGKHLNSGIFFRALPGQYQQGYEAQIRNQFTDKPTQKYTVEEFDPKTHKLTGKKTVLSPAVDFGTGAIYRRVPARRGVAKDGEWFTLTVLARGRHFRTWVNGVPVVDWTDHRPAKGNAREGFRAGPGVLSIQGHDPTTDLSFRNLRIAGLGK